MYSNGDLDPWSGGSPLETIVKNSVVSINIELAAHHLDLRSPNELDPEPVRKGLE